MPDPGYSFIEQYERGLPCRTSELARCIRSYVAFLLEEAALSGDPPVEVEKIYDAFDLRLWKASNSDALADLRGAASQKMGLVVINDNDSKARQRFSQSHELMELLVGALEGNRLGTGMRPYVEGRKKERLCEWGAAQLLMPHSSFSADLKRLGATLDVARTLAERYVASLLATLVRMVRLQKGQVGLIVWRLARKPSEKKKVAASNQNALFEKEYRGGPAKKLRVWWSCFVDQKGTKDLTLVRVHQSVNPESLIVRAFDRKEATSGAEYVSVGELSDECYVEAMPARIGSEQCVISLLQMPDRFQEKKVRQGRIADAR